MKESTSSAYTEIQLGYLTFHAEASDPQYDERSHARIHCLKSRTSYYDVYNYLRRL